MGTTLQAAGPAPSKTSALRLFFDVFKLRIGLVIGFTAVAGAAVTPGPPLPVWDIALLALAVTTAAAAAGAFNQHYERDIDLQMQRTRRRAFVTGRLPAGRGALISIALIAAAGVGLAAFALNALAALYTFLGAFTYGVVYTVWLKRRTPWNIVIGGLAGSFAVLAGAAAVAPGSPSALPSSFALVLFLWTPPHFWSIAIAYRDDYAAARVPMLPVVVGSARAARVVHASAAALVAASLLPAAFGLGGLYLAAAAGSGVYFLAATRRLARTPSRACALASFHASLIQLTVLLVAAMVDSSLHG
jgi:protoheme IX farnesyltransferase